jgi:hypothetical protein
VKKHRFADIGVADKEDGVGCGGGCGHF